MKKRSNLIKMAWFQHFIMEVERIQEETLENHSELLREIFFRIQHETADKIFNLQEKLYLIGICFGESLLQIRLWGLFFLFIYSLIGFINKLYYI